MIILLPELRNFIKFKFWVWQIAVLRSSLFDTRLQKKKTLGKDTCNVFSILKDIFVPFLIYLAIFLVDALTKSKSSNS